MGALVTSEPASFARYRRKALKQLKINHESVTSVLPRNLLFRSPEQAGVYADIRLDHLTPDPELRIQIDPTYVHTELKKSKESVAKEKKQQWDAAFADPYLSFGDLEPYRIRVAYRLIREMAQLGRFVADDELLIDALTETDIAHFKNPYTDLGAFPDGTRPGIDLSEQRLKPLQHRALEYILDGERLTLLPPPTPNTAFDKGVLRDDFNPQDPRQDPDLHRYIATLLTIVDYLGLIHGYIEDPQQGSLGFKGMNDPELIRFIFPDIYSIFQYEAMLVEETLQLLLNSNPKKAMIVLGERYGLMRFEAQRLVAQARVRAAEDRFSDMEEERAIQLLTIDNFIERAREALDPRVELRAIHLRSVISGVTKITPKTEDDDWSTIADEVNAEPKKIDSGVDKEDNNRDG